MNNGLCLSLSRIEK